MVRHYARERAFVAGDVMRVNIFPVRPVAKSRGAKRAPSRECQAALNRRNSKKRFQDIAHLNFTRETGGLRLSLDYNRFIDEYHRNPNEVEWKAYLARYFRELRALYRAHGGELKYMAMTHVGRKAGKVHHHCLISLPPEGVSREEVEALWKAGYGNTDSLKFIKGSIGGLTSYFFDNSVDQRWSCSRNCRRPSETEYADGAPASVNYIDGHMTMADAHYIDNHPEDLAYIAKFFPGYAVARVLPTAEPIVGKDGHVYTTLPFGGPFIEVELYRVEAEREPLRLLGQKVRKGEERVKR